ncbi:MAG: hypothetical protein J5658_15705 [Prevotella sp.]|nr:hypothetical protein [Prevotella sp.]
MNNLIGRNIATMLFALISLTGWGATVTIDDNLAHGKITSSVSGTKATLTAEPADGYFLCFDDLTVKAFTDAGGAEGRRRAPIPIYDIEVTNNGDGTYTFDMPDEGYDVFVTAVFRQASVTLPAGPFTYNGSAQTPAPTVKIGGAPLTVSTDYSVGYSDNTNVGTATVTVTGKGKYFGTATSTFTIGQQTLTITAKPKTITYGDAPDNDGVTYSGFVGTETAAVLGGTLAYAYSYVQYGDVGDTYTITPSGLTSTNYAITYTAGTLSVGQKEIGLSWTNTAPVYTGSALAPTVSATGLVNGDEIGVTVTVAGEHSAVGNYTATASALTGTKAGNYKLPAANTCAFSIVEAGMSGIAATGYSNTYDGAAHGITVNAPAGATVKYRTTATGDYGLTENPTFTDVCDETVYYQVTKSGYTAVTGSAKVTITQKALTITANNQTVNYGTAITKGTDQVTVEGLVKGDALTDITLTASTTIVTTAGSITPSAAVIKNGDNDVTANYDITYKKGTLTINVSDAASAVVTANDLTYDGTAQDLVTIGAITYGATGRAADVVFYENATSTTPLTAVPQGTDADTYDVYYEVKPDANHTAPARTKVTVTIGQKALTITADEKSKVYGDRDPRLTYTYDGLVGTDKIDGALSRADGENVGTYAIAQGSLSAGGNYSITYKEAYLTIMKARVGVTITGHKNSAPYDGKNHRVNGYDVSINNPLYNVTDFTFNGTAEANRTDTGTTNMGLKSDMFVNNNQNFEVTFIVDTDGYQEIVPINVTVTITGHNDVSIYDNKEHTVSGYDVAFSTPVYKEDYFTFNGTAKAKRTEVGTTYMGLAANQFANTNKNFNIVRFNVTDGYQTITSVTDVVVTIIGHRNATDYDGKNHSVSGYDVEISNPLYKESDFTFSGKAEASRKDVGKSNMRLDASQFKNTNPDFTNVRFNVTDGYQEIIAISVVATITGQKNEVIYDGTEHVVEGYNVVFSNPVCTAADIAFSGTDVASLIDVGTVNMGLAPEQFANVNNNFESVLFRVIDGYQTIRPKMAVVNVTVKPKTYDGKPDAEVSGTIDGLVPWEKATVIVSGKFDNEEPGTDKRVALSVEVVWDSAKPTNYLVVDIPSEARGTIIDRRKSGIEVIRNDTGEPVANDAYLTEMPDGTLRVDQINIISPDAEIGIASGVSICLPATLKKPDGTTGAICGVASDIIKTDANVPVTDIYMPDTEKPIDVGNQAFHLNADKRTTARIHTSLALLADYALSAGLKAEYEAGNVMGVGAITAATHYWTFSSAVDVVVPEGVTAYTCQTDGPDAVAAVAITSTTAVVDGKERVIVKANNGVMMGGAPGTYDLVAWPSADRPNGMTPTTEDAKSYEGNMLVPAIVETHFEPSEYYILYNNTFHELEPGDDTSVPAGKAVLRKSSPNMGRILSIHNETSGIRSVYDDSRVGEGQWYSLDGRRLNGKPTAKGLYIHNGKKVIIK